MSYRVVEWVMENAPRHGGSTRAVLVAVAWFAKDDGTGAFPSQATIAQRAGCSERTARDKLTQLEAEGSLVRVGHRAGGGTVEWRVVMAGTAVERAELVELRGPANPAGPEEAAA